MSTVRFRHRDPRVTCALEEAAAAERLAAWRVLRDGAEVEEVVDGVRLWLRSTLRDAALELTALEARCCPFLDFELATEGDRLRLDVTSPAPGAAPAVAAITGLSVRPATDLLA